MSRVGDRLSYANVMSTIAVFLAIGGGAYAASRIGGNDMKRIVERRGGNAVEVRPSNVDPLPARARCRRGEVLIRGGYGLSQPGRSDVAIQRMGAGVRNPRRAFVAVAAREPGSDPVRIRVFAVCLRR